MSLQRQTAAMGAGIVPYLLAAAGILAVNVGTVLLPSRGGLFLLMVAVGLATAFVGPFVASTFNPTNLAGAATFAMVVHAIGMVAPAAVVAITDPDKASPLGPFFAFYLIMGIVSLPIAAAGGLVGAMGRQPSSTRPVPPP